MKITGGTKRPQHPPLAWKAGLPRVLVRLGHP